MEQCAERPLGDGMRVVAGDLGRTIDEARRDVVVVARRQEPLDQLAGELAGDGAAAHAISADLADTDAIPALGERIRAAVGDLDAIYYGTGANGFIPVLDLTPRRAQDIMPVGVYTLLALVREFLPAMIARGKVRWGFFTSPAE